MAAIQALFITCILATLAVVVVVHGVPAPSSSTDCLDILLSDVKECLFYVREGSDAEKPSGSCCRGLNKVAETHGGCICFAIKHAAGLGIPVDMDRAAYLPSACGVTNDIKRSCRDVVSMSPGSSPVHPPAFSPTPAPPTKYSHSVLPPAPNSPIPAPSTSSEPPSPSVLPPELDSPVPAQPLSSEPPSPSVSSPARDSSIPAPLPAPIPALTKLLEPLSPTVLPPAPDSPDSPIPAPFKSLDPPSPSVLPPKADSPDSPIPAPFKSLEPPSPSVLPPAAASSTAPPKSSPTPAPSKPAANSGHSPAPAAANSTGYSISSFYAAFSAVAALLSSTFLVA